MNDEVQTFESKVKQALKILASEEDYSEAKKKLKDLGLREEGKHDLDQVFSLVFQFKKDKKAAMFFSLFMSVGCEIAHRDPLSAAIAFRFSAICFAQLCNFTSSILMEELAENLLAVEDFWVLDLEIGGAK
jgi:hypothetical protein